jgi:hypothetical protein
MNINILYISGDPKLNIIIKNYKSFLDIVQQVVDLLKTDSNIFFDLLYNNIKLYNINHINNDEIEKISLDNIDEITFNIIYPTNMINYLIDNMINYIRNNINLHIDHINNILDNKEKHLILLKNINMEDIYLSLSFNVTNFTKSFMLYTYIPEIYSFPSLNYLNVDTIDELRIIIHFNIIKNKIINRFSINQKIYITKEFLTDFNINEFIEIILNNNNSIDYKIDKYRILLEEVFENCYLNFQ